MAEIAEKAESTLNRLTKRPDNKRLGPNSGLPITKGFKASLDPRPKPNV